MAGWAIITYNQRAGVAACAEAAAVDYHLICVAEGVFFAVPTANLILHVHARIDRADCSRQNSIVQMSVRTFGDQVAPRPVLWVAYTRGQTIARIEEVASRRRACRKSSRLKSRRFRFLNAE